jgi:2-phosphoglycolate phosphatase
MRRKIAVDLLIFDLDGTLVDSLKDIAAAANYTLKKLGLAQKSEAKIAGYIGYGVEGFIKDLLGKSRLSLSAQGLQIFEKKYRLTMFRKTRLQPGVKEILQYFAARKKIIVLLTNKKGAFAKKQLKAFRIDKYFQEILGGDDLSCRKPSPCPVELLLKKYRVDKERCAIIGDMKYDILTGKAAGIMSCALLNGIGRKKELLKAKPDFIIAHLTALKKIFN